MTTPSRVEEIISEMDQDPALAESLRQRILGQDLARLPEAVSNNQQQIITLMQAQLELAAATRLALENLANALIDQGRRLQEIEGSIVEQSTFNEEQRIFNEEQRIFNEEQRTFNQEQKTFNEEQRIFSEEQTRRTSNIETRLTRMEGDSGTLKGYFARNETVMDAAGIAEDMGLKYVRTLDGDELRDMAADEPDRDIRQSFRRADLVIEATDGEDPGYIAMEISYTASVRDCTRAIRNAEILSRLTGRNAQPAIASVRNDREAQAHIDSGTVIWHSLEDRAPNPE